MSQKKPATISLKDTLSELDSAFEQWDSLTNQPPLEQACNEPLLQQKAKAILRKLREQIDEFEDEDDGAPASSNDSAQKESEETH